MLKIKAYEIDLTDYIVPGTEHLHRQDENGELMYEDEDKEVPVMGASYPVKKNMLDIFMSRPVAGRAVIKVNKLGTKIDEHEGDKIYLDKDEYTLIKDAFEKFEGFRPAIDGELARRIFEAEQVDMKPAGE